MELGRVAADGIVLLYRKSKAILVYTLQLLWPFVPRFMQAVISRLGMGHMGLPLAPVVRVFIVVIGNTLGAHDSFLELLSRQVTLERVESYMLSDVILAFCPIVSRVGTDVEVALTKIPEGKPAILVVFHHTFDENYVIPPTSRFTAARKIQTVNCLFYEGILLTTHPNDRAVKDMLAHLELYKDDKRV